MFDSEKVCNQILNVKTTGEDLARGDSWPTTS